MVRCYIFTIGPPSRRCLRIIHWLAFSHFKMRKLPFAIFYQNWLFVRFGSVVYLTLSLKHTHSSNCTQIQWIRSVYLWQPYLLICAFFATLLLTAYYLPHLSRYFICSLLFILVSCVCVCVLFYWEILHRNVNEWNIFSVIGVTCLRFFIGRELISLCLAFISRLLLLLLLCFFFYLSITAFFLCGLCLLSCHWLFRALNVCTAFFYLFIIFINKTMTKTTHRTEWVKSREAKKKNGLAKSTTTRWMDLNRHI